MEGWGWRGSFHLHSVKNAFTGFSALFPIVQIEKFSSLAIRFLYRQFSRRRDSLLLSLFGAFYLINIFVFASISPRMSSDSTSFIYKVNDLHVTALSLLFLFGGELNEKKNGSVGVPCVSCDDGGKKRLRESCCSDNLFTFS